MEKQKSLSFEFNQAAELEEEFFILSSEYVAMEDEYVLWREEVNFRQTKKAVKETGIAEFEEEELIISLQENSHYLEESFCI